MSELLALMQSRHSARVPFDAVRRVAPAALAQILEAARWAPTAHNMQNFDVVAVDDAELLAALARIPVEPSETFIRESFAQLASSEEELQRKKVGILAAMFPPSWRTEEPDMAAIARERADATLGDIIQGSPALLVVVYDPRQRAPASEGDFLGVMSLGCVLENMWLMAESLGLGFQIMSVFGGGEIERRVKELLAVPPELAIACAVRLGHPARTATQPRVRRDVRDFAHHNRFGRHDLG